MIGNIIALEYCYSAISKYAISSQIPTQEISSHLLQLRQDFSDYWKKFPLPDASQHGFTKLELNQTLSDSGLESLTNSVFQLINCQKLGEIVSKMYPTLLGKYLVKWIEHIPVSKRTPHLILEVMISSI